MARSTSRLNSLAIQPLRNRYGQFFGDKIIFARPGAAGILLKEEFCNYEDPEKNCLKCRGITDVWDQIRFVK